MVFRIPEDVYKEEGSMVFRIPEDVYKTLGLSPSGFMRSEGILNTVDPIG